LCRRTGPHSGFSSEYLGSHDVEKEAHRAAPRSRQEAKAMAAAESAGRKRAKGEDPALRRRSAPRVGASRSRGAGH
jgi:hypothetical protein